MKNVFKNLQKYKKAYVIWILFLIAMVGMLQSGVGATMKLAGFNGRFYEGLKNFHVQLDGRKHNYSGVSTWGGSYGDEGSRSYKFYNAKFSKHSRGRKFSHDFFIRGPQKGFRRDDDLPKGPDYGVYYPRGKKHDEGNNPKFFKPFKNLCFGDDCADEPEGKDEKCCFGGNCDNDFPQDPVTTPEPASLVLFGTGLLGLAGLKKKNIN